MLKPARNDKTEGLVGTAKESGWEPVVPTGLESSFPFYPGFRFRLHAGLHWVAPAGLVLAWFVPPSESRLSSHTDSKAVPFQNVAQSDFFRKL